MKLSAACFSGRLRWFGLSYPYILFVNLTARLGGCLPSFFAAAVMLRFVRDQGLPPSVTAASCRNGLSKVREGGTPTSPNPRRA